MDSTWGSVSIEWSPGYATYATYDYDAATYLAHHPHRVVSQGGHLQLVPTVASMPFSILSIPLGGMRWWGRLGADLKYVIISLVKSQ